MVDTQKARQTLDAIEARHRDIVKVEKSVHELHDMFRDLALLVESQVGFSLLFLIEIIFIMKG